MYPFVFSDSGKYEYWLKYLGSLRRTYYDTKKVDLT